MSLRSLIDCERSSVVRRAFKALGQDARAQIQQAA